MSEHSGGYQLTGGTLLETGLKLAYSALSFTAGEALPDWTLVLAVLLVPFTVWLVLAGLRARPLLAGIALPLAAIAFLGVARWVPYSFMPPRLLFLFPF